MQSAPVKDFHCCLKALVQTVRPADNVRGRHADIVKDDVACVRALLPHLPVRLAKRYAWRPCLDEKGAYAGRTFRLWIGPGKNRE